MKIRHHVPSDPHSSSLTPEYEAEVEASMYRGRLRWESEQAALAKAERRRRRLSARKPATARQSKTIRRQIRELDEQIEFYRSSLQETHRLMTASPQGASHRGSKSFRPVPTMSEVV